MTNLTRRARRDEAGETLLEILLTVMIIGITATVLVGAMVVSITASEAHRRLSDSEVLARSYGEAMKSLLLHPAATALAAPIASTHDASSAAFPITVTGSSGFPTAPFDVQIDTEEFTVNAVVANVWTVKAKGSEGHATGARVSRYDACPTSTQVSPTFTVPSNFTVAVTAPTYYDANGAPVSAANCTNFWSSSSTSFCSTLDNPQDHLTPCDPPTIEVLLTITSKDTAASNRKATTKNYVRFRRSDA